MATPGKLNMGAKAIDGSLAGMTGVLATFPLDLAKTRMQNEKVVEGAKKQYRNPFQTIFKVARAEGVRGCYSGMGINFGMISFEKSIKLVGNDFFRNLLKDSNGHVGVGASVMAGALAGAMQSSVTTPMELLKIKAQAGGAGGQGIGQTVRTIVQTEGMAGCYRGWCSTLIRDIPFSMIYFPTYAGLKGLELNGGGNMWNMACGMVAGMAAGGLSTPMDVIKTRLQATRNTASKSSWMATTTNMLKNEGVASLFKGATPRMICIGSLFSVAQVFYELELGELVLPS